MQNQFPFVDIHCHLLPGLDDGAPSWEESLAMARIAAADGIRTVIVTPHQLGAYSHNSGQMIRARTAELRQQLARHHIGIQVLPGADVRIEPDLVEGIREGRVLTLGDRGRHLLLELPHELYFPLEPVLASLATIDICGILSHPERNQGLLKQRQLLRPLVNVGCLLQITAGSLLGTFGPAAQELSEWLIQEGLVHFVATDAHGARARRPLLHRAFERVAELTDVELAYQVCACNPAAVAAGRPDQVRTWKSRRSGRSSWFGWRKAG